MCVNHKDGDKLNNELPNLEITTYSGNMSHALETGLNRNYGLRHRLATLTTQQVSEIKQKFQNGIRQNDLATQYNVHRTTIKSIVNGTNRKRG